MFTPQSRFSQSRLEDRAKRGLLRLVVVWAIAMVVIVILFGGTPWVS